MADRGRHRAGPVPCIGVSCGGASGRL